MRISYIIIFSCLFISLSANVYTQSKSQINSEFRDDVQNLEFEKIKNKLDFSDTEKIWKLKDKEKEEKKEKSKIDFPRSSGFNINGSFTNILAYLLIIVLIMAVIFMIFSNARVDKKILEKETTDDYIEDIEEIDAIDGFKLALNAGDYRSAIRMQFIKVLQLLQENNKINWKPEKTNKDYLRELSENELKSKFKGLSGIYELVWYGNTKIDRENFQQLNPSFEKFINGFNG